MVKDRYEFRETRNASAIIAATNATELQDLISVLEWFRLSNADITGAGGNKSDLAARIDERFRELGWREGRHDTRIESALRLMPYRPAGERDVRVTASEVINEGYKVDNVKGRVALDVEWNAKDGNLDRDIGAYRALYHAGIIDVGVILTRTQDDLRELARSKNPKTTKFGTTTTTNLTKLIPRMTRGDGGGCPLLAVAITSRCV
ncbi:MAG: BglII/BstYI family type II restriction endonuclease [Planctomycetota bacterium]